MRYKFNTKYNVAYYAEYQKVYLKKDAFLYPYYLAKAQDVPLRYYYGYNEDERGTSYEYRGVEIVHYRNRERSTLRQFVNLWRCAIWPAKHIKTLFLIHTGHENILATILFKMRNPKGHVVLMADMDEECAETLCSHDFVFSTGLRGWVKRKLVHRFFNSLDVISGEKKQVVDLMQVMVNRNSWKVKPVLCHPCLDIETFNALGLTKIPYAKKENAFLTVGRLGTYQKNTEMMLEALAKVDLKGWKFYFIGPMIKGFDPREESDFGRVFERFFQENPDKKENVIVVGEVTDIKTLFEYYLHAKVFVLTSRFEGFANVTAEAAALGCYLVGTDVGGMEEMSNHWRFGAKVEQEDAAGLANVMQSIIDGTCEVETGQMIGEDQVMWDKMVKQAILPLL